MTQKQIDRYLPRDKRSKRPRESKEELDKWKIRRLFKGQRSVWNPDCYDPENPPTEDCAEVEICNQRTGEVVTFKDDPGMIEFWKELQGIPFKWEGGKRIQKKTIVKKMIENGDIEVSRVQAFALAIS